MKTFGKMDGKQALQYILNAMFDTFPYVVKKSCCR